jgi:hypothetical protein
MLSDPTVPFISEVGNRRVAILVSLILALAVNIPSLFYIYRKEKDKESEQVTIASP